MNILQKTVLTTLTSIAAVSAFAGTAAVVVHNRTPFNTGVTYSTHRPGRDWVKHHIVIPPHQSFKHRYKAQKFRMNILHLHTRGRNFGPRRFKPCGLYINPNHPHGRITVNIRENRYGHGNLGCVVNRWK